MKERALATVQVELGNSPTEDAPNTTYYKVSSPTVEL